jgi:hypothetical protein
MVKRILLFCFAAVLLSCSDDDEAFSGLTIDDRNVIEYFCDVALGVEFGGAAEVTRKWRDEMRIFVGGNTTPALLDELASIITEVNTLATDGFQIRIVLDSLEMNYYIFFGPADTYAKIYPSQAGLVEKNWGLFNIFWDPSNQIYAGNMYVDIDRANDIEEKHLLREELTQSLGLAKDSRRYPESIFQTDWTTTNAYASIDKELIRLLYHPEMETGVVRSDAETLLAQVLLNEK